MRRQKPKGFTVMEMLVVLVLLGLVTTLLMQGFSHVLLLRVRFLEHLEHQRTGIIKDFWFREVCSSLAPERPEGEWKFVGQENQLQGLSLASLRGHRGVPTPVVLELINQEGALVLQYKEIQREDVSWEIGRWPGGEGGFQYLDEAGEWHRQWPPARKESSQLPHGILLSVEDYRGPKSWMAALPGRYDPLVTVEETVKEMFGKGKK